jgi:hypothetical protein
MDMTKKKVKTGISNNFISSSVHPEPSQIRGIRLNFNMMVKTKKKLKNTIPNLKQMALLRTYKSDFC